MPPRLSKRLQREQEELEALRVVNVVKQEEEEEDDDDDSNQIEQVASSSTAIGFAALIGSEDEKENETSSSEGEANITAKSKKSKSKKKKKKKQIAVAQLDTNTQSAPAKLPKSKGGGTSSKSGNNNKSSKAKQDDEFDKALAELSGKFSTAGLSSQTRSRGDSNQARALYSLLSVNIKNLDPEAELRRFFGSKVISTSGNAGPSTSHSSRIRSNLAKHQTTWPPPQYRAGLSMRELTPEEHEEKNKTRLDFEAKSERWWTIEASPRYKAVTYEYLQGVMGGDPQLFFNLLYETPWHVDTLLQVAEVFRHREEHSTASDFTSRALFAYERSFSSAFNFTTGIHRLDFDRVENRVLYLALARHITDLNRRGTPQTAFEFARLLLGLDPHTDPQGALLYLDSFAIKAKQHDWLLKLWNTHEDIMNVQQNSSENKKRRFNVTLLPGWHWSRALALFEQEGERDNAHVRSTEALKTAILTFPSIAPLLADKLDVPIKDELRQLDCFRIVTEYNTYRDDLSTSLLHLLSHIYLLRSSSVWKIPARIDWFSKTLASIPLSSFSSTSLITQTRFKDTFSIESSLTDSIYRHVIVVAPLIADFRRLFSFSPQSVKKRMQETIEGDPLPPLTVVSMYNDAYFLDLPVDSHSRSGGSRGRGDNRNGNGNVVERLIQNIQGAIANPEQGRRLQEMLQAHPQFAERFPGGLEQLAEMVREFPNDVLNAMGLAGIADDVVVNNDDDDDGGVHPMPGDLNVPWTEYDEPEEPEEAEMFFPVRIIRNLTARFWGSNNDSNEVDVEGSETSHGEDSPVHTQDEVD
ncbi:hypothetical protein Clacol_002083 [Clathrus columnatus]|uniref:Transcription factor 25 n=1 Tax=Clathrus columnatus TaxID=1419009 RepID=A0AAV4ZZR3_9AGAM|nr:hypothetical protein Clacol_002083 [Clathrus columnatus]